MRRLGIASIVGVSVLAAAGACSNSADLGGTGPDGGGSSETSAQNLCTAPTTEPTCEAPVDVASADQAAAIIGALAEPKFSATKSDFGAALKPSRDLRATAAIELDAARFRGTADTCAGRAPSDGCTETWAFSGEKTAIWNFPVTGGTPARALPAGVLCVDASCSKIAIAAGTVVRFQRVFEPFGFISRFSHYVRVVRPCATPCDGDELRCTDSSTCLEAKAFCTLCEGQKNDVCACRDGCSAVAAGTWCSYVTSDDTKSSGTCNGGPCSR